MAGFVTSAAGPDGVPAEFVPAPMPPEVADHVAAVALFGKPSAEFMRQYGAPPIAIGPLYAAAIPCALEPSAERLRLRMHCMW